MFSDNRRVFCVRMDTRTTTLGCFFTAGLTQAAAAEACIAAGGYLLSPS